MSFWLFKTIFLSLLVISIVHYLYLFFKENLTQPKIKDLLHQPKFEYDNIKNILNDGLTHQVSHEPIVNDSTKINDLPNNNLTTQNSIPQEMSSMKDELSQFLLDNNNDLITTQNEGEYNNFSFNMVN